MLDGSIVAGSLVRKACQRHREDLEHATNRGFHFDDAKAERAVQVIGCLKHTTGEYAGELFDLRPWQVFIVASLHGWRKADGTRRFRKAFISVARGNGKTPLAAALANVMFIGDDPIEYRAQVYSFATKEKQARIAWEEAKAQIEKSGSDYLQNLVKTQRSNMHIEETGSKFEPLGSDSKTNSGWNIHCAIKDEFHEWGDYHRGLNATIDTAMAKRRQPMMINITTAGDDNSVLWVEEYDWCEQVLNGLQEADDLFIFIAEVDKDRECEECSGKGCEACDDSGRVEVDIFDEKNWPMANPMLNDPRSPVKIDELRSFAAKAKVIPSKERELRRYHGNQKVVSYTRLYTPELWARGNKPLANLKDRECYFGYDAGGRNDLASLVGVWFLEELRQYHVQCWAWITAECPHDLTDEPWAKYIRSGELTVTDGNTTDIDAIYDTMEEIVSLYQVKSLAYDPNNAREFGTRCVNKWGIQTYGFPQNCSKYNEPVESLIGALQDSTVHHGGNELLAWAATNAVAVTNSMGHKMPNKAKSKGKIDPLVALLMGWSEAQYAEKEEPGSFSFAIETI